MGYYDHYDPTSVTSNLEKYVCAECVNDIALASLINANAEQCVCSYCRQETDTPSAAPIETLIEHMRLCVARYFDDPNNGLGWDKEWMGVTMDTSDMLEEMGFEPKSEELLKDCNGAFGDQEWCEAQFYGLNDLEALQYGWQHFKTTVKHSRRFTFHQIRQSDPSDPEIPPAGRMLKTIGRSIADAGVTREIATGTRIWRVRCHDVQELMDTEEKFYPPPTELAAQSNRMSPAGIVMFYGAETFDTAAKETTSPSASEKAVVSGIQFEATKPLHILDLTAIPYGPSRFELEAYDHRTTLEFLRGFAGDVSQPISRDGREHVEYAPTQAFTEYVRYEMKINDRPVDGIAYRSCKDGGVCYVFFCTDANCRGLNLRYPSDDCWFQADIATLRKVSAIKFVPKPKCC